MLATDPIYIDHAKRSKFVGFDKDNGRLMTDLIFSTTQLIGIPSTVGMIVKYNVLLMFPLMQISLTILVGRKITGAKNVSALTLLSKSGNQLQKGVKQLAQERIK
jgi:hypothetical protein